MKRKIVLAVLTAMFVVLIVTGLNGAASQGDELEDCTTINVEKTVWGDIEKTQWSNDQWSEHIQVPNGATVIFNITVENLGPCIIFDVYVNDTLPDGFVYQTGTAIVNGIPCEPTLSENGLLWFFPGWFVNDYIWYIEFNATANGKSCETYVNQVDVTAYQDPDHVLDPCIDDDSASVLIEGMCAKKQVSKNGQEWYDELNVLIGDTIRFRIEITFYGDYNLSNINVTDYLPECLEYTDNAVIQKTLDGIPKPASFETGPNSLWVGRSVGVAGLGHHLATEALDGHLHFHAHSEYVDGLSTVDAKILNAYSCIGLPISHRSNFSM